MGCAAGWGSDTKERQQASKQGDGESASTFSSTSPPRVMMNRTDLSGGFVLLVDFSFRYSRVGSM
jgi:hypothetical protein